MDITPFVAAINVPWDAIGYSLIGFVGGFLLGALFGKRSYRAKA